VTTLGLALAIAGGIAACAWLAVLVDPARAWDLRPVGEEEPAPAPPAAWPSVAVVVPARDERESLPATLPPLLAQEYDGPWHVVLVDDRSSDGTGDVARKLAGDDRRLTVIDGASLDDGWAGKVWALEQGVAAARQHGATDYVLLTDADIHHEPSSLRRLVAESEAAGLALNSRMALLRTVTGPERLLIPPFVLFFNLLYPMRRVNDPRRRLAAAAGGCVLVRREALERAGGPAAIRGEVIDDVNLAKRIKALGEPIRLSTSRSDVVSQREYGSVAAVWRMVRRTAFDQLRYSWLLLAGTVLGLLLLFALPPALVVLAAALGAAGATPAGDAVAFGLAGLTGWTLMTAAYATAVRFFRLAPGWALTLPVAGVLFGGMTLDSARRHRRGARRVW
jgi:hopene-associated glycosyltransferase HpnB